MKFILQEEDDSLNLIHDQWDIAFIGSAIDDRCTAAILFATKNSESHFVVNYLPKEMILTINDKPYYIDDLDVELGFIHKKNIIIESSSLSFVEILLLLKQAKSYETKIAILYLEPLEYKRTRQKIYDRVFELSGDSLGYLPIPGFSHDIGYDRRKISIFLAGY
jgi:hypothetical protein